MLGKSAGSGCGCQAGYDEHATPRPSNTVAASRPPQSVQILRAATRAEPGMQHTVKKRR